MRKITFHLLVILLIMCTLYAKAQSASTEINDRSYSTTIQLGNYETFCPYINSNVPASSYWTSGYEASLLNPNDIDILAISTTSIKGWGNYTCEYANYKIVPKKSGTYTCKFFVEYVPAGYTKANTKNVYITLDITVLEVKSISIPTTLSFVVGESYTFSPIITDMGATTNMTWSSDNSSVATISADGILSAVGIGKTTVTCMASNGVFAQCEVTVNPVLVSDITLNRTKAELTVGENLLLETTVAPYNATEKGIIWSSTDESVAVVDETGLVTAVGSGTCQIKATANDNSGKTASCLISVAKDNKLTVTDMTQCSGGRGVLNILLSDEETIMGFQFDLQLPTGVTVAENDGELIAELTGNAVNTHGISSSKVGEGLYRFIVTPQGSRAISNANGDGMTITIDVADDVAIGTYTMTIQDIEMTVKKVGNVFEDIHPRNSTATLIVTEAMMGDVNGDGRISVTDVISIISYIQEDVPASFIIKSADMNGDNRVSITDAVQVIDIILGKR